MLVSKKTLVLVIVLAGLPAFFGACTQQETEVPVQIDTVLQTAIEQCGDITERAAADLVAIVEFQRLEIIGRKARVFKMCMQDHGFIENPVWLNYSQSVAQKLAEKNHISVNEALENLRRANMILPMGEGDRPNYWLKNGEATPNS
ncbi:MAG: hypothetical protein KFB94_06060 [Methylophilaceae bacterium]|jgi:hypothetical protein|nr:MAG: hypothetical protein KFB94_06060 [Methylophilaceae bacterium]